MGLLEVWLIGMAMTWVFIITQQHKHDIGGVATVMLAVFWPVTLLFGAMLYFMEALDDLL